MKFQNMGTFDGGTVVSSPASAAAPQRFQTMDAAAIANGGAFLSSELEKRDNTIRQPLTSFTYGRDIPVRVGGVLSGLEHQEVALLTEEIIS